MVVNPWIAASRGTPERTARRQAADKSRPSTTPGSFAEQFLAGKSGAEESYSRRYVEEATVTEEAAPVDAAQEAAPASTGEEPAAAVPEKALFMHVQAARAAIPELELPALNQSVVRRIKSNTQELSLIEGHLLRMSRELRSLYFASCFPGEGRSTAALMAAFGLANLSERSILLTETNAEKPVLGRLFGMEDSPGLQDVLLGNASLETAIVPTAYPHLYVLPAGSGRVPLHDPRVKPVFDTITRNFDYMLLDGKPAMSSSEAMNVANAVGGVLLVVECERTKWEVVQMVHERLIEGGAHHVGVVLNKRKFYVPRIVYNFMSRH